VPEEAASRGETAAVETESHHQDFLPRKKRLVCRRQLDNLPPLSETIRRQTVKARALCQMGGTL